MVIDSQIRKGYDQMWSGGKLDLIRGDIDVDPVPNTTSKRWGVSAILRLPVDYGESLQSLVDQLKAYTGEGQMFYDPTTFHITLRSIEYFREQVTSDDKQVKTYGQLLKQLEPNKLDLSTRFEGLSANRVGVILQGYPQTPQLQSLRQQFHDLLDQQGLLQGPEQIQPRINAHTSLIVYGSSQLNEPEELVHYIQQNRSKNYGQVKPASLDLVRYEKTPKWVNIVTLDQIPLQ